MDCAAKLGFLPVSESVTMVTDRVVCVESEGGCSEVDEGDLAAKVEFPITESVAIMEGVLCMELETGCRDKERGDRTAKLEVPITESVASMEGVLCVQ